MSDWQPIESAPKGRKLLLFYRNACGKGRTILGTYYRAGTLPLHDSVMTETDDGCAEEGWYEESETHEDILPTDCPPTHWMPMPEQPK